MGDGSYVAEGMGVVAEGVSVARRVPSVARRCLNLLSEFQKTQAAFFAVVYNASMYVVVLLLLFIVHQLFLWVDRDPETAFDRSVYLFEVAEISWDMTGVVANSAIDVANAGFIPLWNAGVHYVVEPGAVLLLEVMSLVFVGKHYTGLIDEGDFPYNGFDCLATPESAKWCGLASYYETQLLSAERAPFYANETQTRRALATDEEPARTNFTFSIATARRLSELGGGGLAVPAFATDDVTEALDALADFALTIAPGLLDVAYGVVGNILQTSFAVIMDGVKYLLESALFVMKMLVKSGMFSTLVGVGVDFVIILITEISIPMLFAALDVLVCLIDFLSPSGWGVQLECVERHCFQGPDVMADMLLFVSVPIFMQRFAAIADATLSSRTGKRLANGFTTGEFTTKGRTRNPATDEVIDNEEPDAASAGNPLLKFSLAEEFESWIPTTGAQTCGACFVCKWPELRLLWLLTASIASLVSEQNFMGFSGDVAQHCGSNGSWYVDACGPLSAEQLPYAQWRGGQHTAGFAQIDGRLLDTFASAVMHRHERAGADRTVEFAQLVKAADQWQSGAGTPEADRAAVLVYHACRNMRKEARFRNVPHDAPEKYYTLPEHSVGRITSEFLFAQHATHPLELRAAVNATRGPSAAHAWRPLFPWQVQALQVSDLQRRGALDPRRGVRRRRVRARPRGVQEGADRLLGHLRRRRRLHVPPRLRDHRRAHRAQRGGAGGRVHRVGRGQLHRAQRHLSGAHVRRGRLLCPVVRADGGAERHDGHRPELVQRARAELRRHPERARAGPRAGLRQRRLSAQVHPRAAAATAQSSPATERAALLAAVAGAAPSAAPAAALLRGNFAHFEPAHPP
jgi:hypothetical protein